MQDLMRAPSLMVISGLCPFTMPGKSSKYLCRDLIGGVGVGGGRVSEARRGEATATHNKSRKCYFKATAMPCHAMPCPSGRAGKTSIVSPATRGFVYNNPTGKRKRGVGGRQSPICTVSMFHCVPVFLRDTYFRRLHTIFFNIGKPVRQTGYTRRPQF
jgi:hypothetical protein